MIESHLTDAGIQRAAEIAHHVNSLVPRGDSVALSALSCSGVGRPPQLLNARCIFAKGFVRNPVVWGGGRKTSPGVVG